MSKGGTVVVAVLAFAAIFYVVATHPGPGTGGLTTNASPTPTSIATSGGVQLGKQGRLYSGSGTVAVAATPDDMEKAIRSMSVNDTIGLRQIMNSGRFVQAVDGTRVLVIDVTARLAVGMSQVRMIDGPYANQSGWVLDNAVLP